MCPKELLPTADKKKSHRRKGTYCQKLARRLDRFDEDPSLWKPELKLPPPPFLRLPTELRQNILFHVLEDDEVSIPRPNSMTRDLAQVCSVFAADLPAVVNMWDARAALTSKLFGYEKSTMSALIKDMMGPIKSASAALKTQKSLRSVGCKKEKDRKQRKKQRPADFKPLNAGGIRHTGRPASTQEMAETTRWRRARILADGRSAAKLDIPRSATRAKVLNTSIAGQSTKTVSEVPTTGGAKKGVKDPMRKESEYDWANNHPYTSPGVEREKMLRAYLRSVRDAV